MAVPRDDGGTVQVYVGDPDRLDADVAWPGQGTLRERVEQYVREEDVQVARD